MRHFILLAAVFGTVFPGITACIAVTGARSDRNGSSSTITTPLRSGPRDSACGVFEGALCVCDDLSHAGALHVSGGGLGIDGRFSAASSSSIEGDLVAWEGFSMAGDLEVGGNLETAGDVSGAGRLSIGRDLVAQGSVSVAGELEVGGKRIHAMPKYKPCGCNASDLIDVAAAVARAKTNATRIDRLDSIGEGRWYVQGDLTTAGLAHMKVSGHASVYVDGNIESAGERRIELAPGATLDLFVAGSIAHAGEIVFGDPDRPSAFRMYVGGDGEMIVGAGNASFSGLVYAPRANIAFAGNTVVRGAVFAKSISYAGDLRVELHAPEKSTCDREPTPANPTPNDPNENDAGSNDSGSSSDGGSQTDSGAKPDAGSCQ